VRVIGCAIDDDVAVCTCLIVVAVANATATPKATMNAVKANFGPMMRPPIVVSSTPRAPHMGSRCNDSNPCGNLTRQQERLAFARFPGAVLRCRPQKDPGSKLGRRHAREHGLAAQKQFDERFIEPSGTRIGGRSYSASAKSSGFQFLTAIYLIA